MFLRPRVLGVLLEYWWPQFEVIESPADAYFTPTDETLRRFKQAVALFTSPLIDIELAGQSRLIAVLDDNKPRPVGRINLVFGASGKREFLNLNTLSVSDELLISEKPWSRGIDSRALPLAFATLLLKPEDYWAERVDANMAGAFCFTQFTAAFQLGNEVLQPALVLINLVSWLFVKVLMDGLKNNLDVDESMEPYPKLAQDLALFIDPQKMLWKQESQKIDRDLVSELYGVLRACRTVDDNKLFQKRMAALHVKARTRANDTYQEIKAFDSQWLPMGGIAEDPITLYETIVNSRRE
jgi:hypothetical protein